ncbi:hypothetical protein DEA98_15985 [Brucella pseudogrignonensis]|uniref:Uncharacterized protein n=1 Tax=Brucella pseudogrignonensis TaxID=419475 RepID=A0A7Y3T4C7_9HYPH|nr:hypothetical protein [Brucella pseudogrignonensis]MCM0752205.1 hypothetical protein [Brucella pseudogrignonensis]NNV19940.1 hypothetical protein [Brucella pseudogrignonensis]
MTPQEYLVQAVNDNSALSLILTDLFDKDDVRQDYLARQLAHNSDRLQRALAAWQKELSEEAPS